MPYLNDYRIRHPGIPLRYAFMEETLARSIDVAFFSGAYTPRELYARLERAITLGTSTDVWAVYSAALEALGESPDDIRGTAEHASLQYTISKRRN